MKTFLVVVLLVALACGFVVEAKVVTLKEKESEKLASGCNVNIDTEFPKPQPLLLVPGTDQFHYPQSNDSYLHLEYNELLELACDSGFQLAADLTSIMVKCVPDKKFRYGNKVYQFSDFSCTKDWTSKAIRTNQPCEANAFIVQIGFGLGSRFPKVMDICHNIKTFENHWIKHEYHQAHAAPQSGVLRPSTWQQGCYFPRVDVNELYKIKNETQTLAQILGSQKIASQLVQNTATQKYMARGHIAARADFIYETQQNATMWLLAVAPQWQKFNVGNWLRIEAGCRSFIAAQNLNVTVYSGVYGVQTQTDVNGKQQPIFLDFKPNGTRRLPAPAIYYKILFDERNKAGIVLIGVNNIYITSMQQINDAYMFCEDIGDKINWIKWDRKNFTKGYSYACEVNPFLKRIGHLRHLDVPNLLVPRK